MQVLTCEPVRARYRSPAAWQHPNLLLLLLATGNRLCQQRLMVSCLDAQ